MSPTAVRDQVIAARREELLTIKEYATIVRQHPRSIDRRIRAGRQPGAVRVGREYRIDITIACGLSASVAKRCNV